MACLAALPVVWTYPLVRHMSTHLPGGGFGDNVAFLWNVWWMRMALDGPLEFFRTGYLFVPSGVELTLHTHTALPAFLGATVLGTLDLTTAFNVTVLIGVWLAACTAYLLAWRITRSRSAAVIAGLVFGGSPFISAHLHGHFNLTSAWVVPLFALTLGEAIGRRSAAWAAAAGLVLGATAYVDYYLLVYEVALAAVVFVLETIEWKVFTGRETRWSRAAARVLLMLLLLDVCAIATILVTGGFTVDVLGVRVSATTVLNPLQVFWGLLAALILVRRRPRIAPRVRSGVELAAITRAAAIASAVFLVGAAPLVWRGADLLLRGDYVTQRYFWRTAPKGVDLGTLVLGNPFHGLSGTGIERAYEAMALDRIEGSGWLGFAPAILAGWAIRRRWDRIAVRRWTVIGIVFFVWALGPHLMAFGVNTGLILPHTLIREIPLVSNARIPGRAMVVVYLALAMLTAVSISDWTIRPFTRRIAAVVAGLAIAADFVPAPFPLTALDRPPIYNVLRTRPETGAVCELPLGIRDGFGERGSLDERVLFYQTIHGRPVTGGFVARLPPRVLLSYERDPLFAALLKLSGDDEVTDVTPPDRQRAHELLQQNGIGFLVLNRLTASGDLIEYVERGLPVEILFADEERTLYRVSPALP